MVKKRRWRFGSRKSSNTQIPNIVINNANPKSDSKKDALDDALLHSLINQVISGPQNQPPSCQCDPSVVANSMMDHQCGNNASNKRATAQLNQILQASLHELSELKREVGYRIHKTQEVSKRNEALEIANQNEKLVDKLISGIKSAGPIELRIKKEKNDSKKLLKQQLKHQKRLARDQKREQSKQKWLEMMHQLQSQQMKTENEKTAEKPDDKKNDVENMQDMVPSIQNESQPMVSCGLSLINCHINFGGDLQEEGNSKPTLDVCCQTDESDDPSVSRKNMFLRYIKLRLLTDANYRPPSALLMAATYTKGANINSDTHLKVAQALLNAQRPLDKKKEFTKKEK